MSHETTMLLLFVAVIIAELIVLWMVDRVIRKIKFYWYVYKSELSIDMDRQF